MVSPDKTNPFSLLRFRPGAEDGPAGGATRLKAVRDFGANPGDLAMKAYTPAGLKPGAPLVVVLHGCTQLAGGFESSAGWTALADEHRFAVLYPEQRRVNNPKLCFTWFQSEDVTRGQGEVASIRQMIETMIVRHKLDRARVFVTGLSAGGAMASAMLATYPDVFAGGAIVAGLPYGAANGVGEAFSAMFQGRRNTPKEWGDKVRAASDHAGPWPKIAIWHGSADSTVVAQNAEESAKQWANVHGLTLGEPRKVTKGKLSRRVWGDGAVEVNLIAGMNHGVPLDAAAGETPGPFMLDVGVSQARATLAFWGIAAEHKATIRAAVEADAAARAPKKAPAPIGKASTPNAPAPEPLTAKALPTAAPSKPTVLPAPRAAASPRLSRMPQPAPRKSSIEAVIHKALRAAGLMK